MSVSRLSIALYLQNGVRTSTLHAQPTETREAVIQLAFWLAKATIGTAVVESSEGGTTRQIRVARHPKAGRPLQPGARRDADRRQACSGRLPGSTSTRRDELARMAGRTRSRTPSEPSR